MALKARLEALEGLDDSVKGLYRQDGEVFLLDVEGVDGWALEDIGGLRTTVQKERKAAREATAALSAYKLPDGNFLDPTDALDAIVRVEEFSKLDPEKDAEKLAAKKIEDARTVINAEWQNKEASWKDREGKLLMAASHLAINTSVDLAIGDPEVRGISKALKPVLLPMIGSKEDENGRIVTFVRDPGDPDHPRVNPSTGKDFTIKEAALEVKKDADLQGLFLPPERKGGGPTPPHRPDLRPNGAGNLTGSARIAAALAKEQGAR